MKYMVIAFLFASCLQEEKDERRQLDIEAQELQRLAFWQRAYYFEAIKWRGKNTDSVAHYENKMDSVVTLYNTQMIRYDTMVELYKETSKN